MARQMLEVARNTVRRAVRDKVLYSIFFFGLLLVGASQFGEDFTIGVADRVMRDIATGAIDMIGLLMAVFLGITEVASEIKSRTIYGTLTTPLSRTSYLFGKYLGLMIVLTCSLVPMFVEFLAIHLLVGTDALPLGTMIAYLLLRLLSLGIVVALALFFSVIASTFVAASSTLGLYIAGAFSMEIQLAAERGESEAFKVLAKVLYLVLPHFDLYDLSQQVAHAKLVDPMHVGFGAVYAVGYALTLLAITSLIFSRKDLC